MQKFKMQSKLSPAFTIVELLVVIVVIGVLATITIISYTGITQKAIASSLQSDLNNASTQLKMDQVVNSAYPVTLAAANGGKGIPASPGTTYQYAVNNNITPQTFSLTATKGVQSYNVNQDGAIVLGGRNLLPNSQDLQTTPNNTGLGTAVKMLDETIPYWRVTATTTISTYEAPIYVLPLSVGTVYTVSCGVRVPTAGTVGFYASRGMNAGVPANVWTKIYYTFTYTSSYRVGGNTYAGTQLDYRNWKVETGSIATDWTPSF